MNKSLVLYHEIDVGRDPVNCIYLIFDDCHAQPFATRTGTGFYSPSEDDKKRFCQVADHFKNCPRFVAYQNHLLAIGMKKS